jgi:hypothetical protein
MLKIINNLKKLKVEINIKGKRRTPFVRRPSLKREFHEE